MDKPFLKLLDKIEENELKSLVWGDIHGSLSEDDVIRFAEELGGGDYDAEELLEELFEKGLVFDVGNDRVRSRFAETVRLLVQLRQLFNGRPWQGAPRLVSDFRIDLRKRSYPARNKAAKELRLRHEEILGASPLRKDLWKSLAEDTSMQLAAFQERSILRLLEEIPNSGTIITAGTGSGKTLAYYLPILLRVCDLIQANNYWVKALSIYPRTELLKDQLAETFKRSRMLDQALKDNNKRPILMGAFFGSTPTNADFKSVNGKWDRLRGSFHCPWFSCPKCGGNLIWRDEDLNNQLERLNCIQVSCDTIIDETQLVLTRSSLAKNSPDLLFTTTEMLNQRMSDIEYRKLFGLGLSSNQKPRFILLDEAHTYAGINGAQAALVLRRWRHLLNAPVTWCGLSATLNEGTSFFSELVGLKTERVLEIKPETEELEKEGAEYQIILKGDPTLSASILSTSIQSAMLTARMLDPISESNPISEGYFGKRLFIFTDDLDVTNRLFDNICDAENNLHLASLRGRGVDENQRDIEGQRWRVCEHIRHDLDDNLIVGRTSSQDTGVHINANVIVATAALEVGYDDEDVGAVLQHKAPRSYASFLQRKGRAGRTRGMRPITVTILSEYGRDRVSFQNYEHLFDPSVPYLPLPIQNQYVLRIQAVYSLIDWLATQINNNKIQFGWLWNVLSQPVPKEKKFDKNLIVEVKKSLQSLMQKDSEAIDSLKNHLKNSLCVSEEEIDSILWSPPRSLLLEALPTLIRRLYTDWELAYPIEGQTHDFMVPWHPLPDFMPRTLFSDLSLPEVEIEMRGESDNEESTYERVPIVQAIRQLAPGRVTRRFAYQRSRLSHWVAVDITVEEQVMSVDQYAEQNEMIGKFKAKLEDGIEREFPVYRPWYIVLSVVNRREVLDTSNAEPIWLSEFNILGDPLIISRPARSSWFKYVSDVYFYMHRFRSSIAVRRFTHKVHASLRDQDGGHFSVVKFSDLKGEDAAIGFEIEVDGFYVDFDLPHGEDLVNVQLPSRLEIDNRWAYLRYRWLNDAELPLDMGTLEREWIHQILLSAAIVKAIRDDINVLEASKEILEDLRLHFSNVMNSLLTLDDNPDNEERTRLEERILNRIEEPLVINRLEVLVQELGEPDSHFYSIWLRETLHETLAEALLQACINTATRQASTDTIVSDFIPSDQDGRVWITETTIGGAGVIQAFADAFTREPRSLFRALEASLAPTDIELSSIGLKSFVSLVCTDEEIKNIVNNLRLSGNHEERQNLQKKLYKALMLKGIDVSHSLKVSINSRFLRPEMNNDWDMLLNDLLNYWEKLENKFSIAIGFREFCYIAIRQDEYRGKLIDLIGQGQIQDSRLIQIISGLLWPHGVEVRQKIMDSYNPFRKVKSIDPALVRSLLLEPNIPHVKFKSTDWEEKITRSLSENGTVQLVSERSEETSLRAELIRLISEPVDVNFLQFWPIIERMERSDTETKITLTIREQV